MWLLVASLAQAGAMRVTLEIGPDGPLLRDARPVAGAPRATQGPLELLDARGTVIGSAAVPNALDRTIAYPEGGGAGARLTRALVRVDVPWPEGADRVRLGDREIAPRPNPPPGDRAVAIQTSGPADQRLDLVFLGDGYTSGQLDDFSDDVDWIVDYLLTIEPYGAYTGLFNIWRVDVASQQSGVTHLETGVSRDTAYSCYYGCAGIDRLVCCDDWAVLEVVDAEVPGADGVMVLINDPVYGGSGGFTYATSYVGRTDGHQVAAHELGHTLVGLWDEYGYGYDSPGSGPNCSGDPGGHWDEWRGTQGVDAYPECSYDRLYRPTPDNCMMRTLADDYCPVCRQEAILAMYAKVPRLILSVDPPEGSEVDATDQDVTLVPEVIGPDGGLVFEWTVDGEVVSTDPELDLTCSGINGEVRLAVYDDTAWVRSDPNGVLTDQAGPWLVTSEPCLRVQDVFEACDGCSTSGAHGAGWWLGLGVVALRRRR